MKHLDLTLPSPAENLACDEALLDECEQGAGEEVLRFWEPREPFVVVGYANKVATEVNVAACAAMSIPIFRRCSGGGTVLQGPGCLNYAVVLRITENGPLHSISTANRFIMERNRAALENLLKQSVAVRGHTDLVTGDRKFSGNSQRRRRRFLLFHGSFLLNFNLPQIKELLRMPSHQPAYRQNRSHLDFLKNLGLPAGDVKAGLRTAWSATQPYKDFPAKLSAPLATDKYSTDAWNFRF